MSAAAGDLRVRRTSMYLLAVGTALPAAALYITYRLAAASATTAPWIAAAALTIALGAVTFVGQRRSRALRRQREDFRIIEGRLHAADAALRAQTIGRAADALEAAYHRERMHQNERRLIDAQRVAHIGSWEWDPTDQSVTWSDETFRIFGLAPGEIEPSFERYVEYVHPDDRALVTSTIQRSLETGEPFLYDQRIVRADGVERITISTGAVTRDASGRPILMSGTSQDVTEQRAMENARRRSDERFRGFVEATNEWIWTSDLAGVATYSNPAVLRVLGYAPEDLIGRPWENVLHPDDLAGLMSGVQAVAAAGAGWTGWVHRWRHIDGSYRFLESNAVPMFGEEGEVVGYAGASRDVTDRRAAEDALRLSDERFHLAARATHDILWDWDVSSDAMWTNEGFRTFVGHDDARPRGRWEAWLHPDDAEAVSASLRDFLASRDETWQAEYRFRRADGSWAWILERALALRHDDGTVRRMLGSMMDITDRKEAERMKSDFVALVSHQLRTPLSGMNWMLELAADVDGMPSDAARYIQAARDSAHRLVLLVNDLLDIARLESGRAIADPEPVPLAELTRSVMAELGDPGAGRREHVFIVDGDVAPAWADAQMMRQVVTNLLSNAIKYTRPGGHIAVSLRQVNGSVHWSVQDDGIGIPPEAQGRLFEKFYRAENAADVDAEGTGLGLHLVRLIVEDAGGRVWCQSQEGQGSVFAFTVPAAPLNGKANS